jgi:hypothetical protein
MEPCLTFGDDLARAEGGRPIGPEDADYATGMHPENHPAGHSGAKDGGAREAGMPVPMGATQAQATDLSTFPSRPGQDELSANISSAMACSTPMAGPIRIVLVGCAHYLFGPCTYRPPKCVPPALCRIPGSLSEQGLSPALRFCGNAHTSPFDGLLEVRPAT